MPVLWIFEKHPIIVLVLLFGNALEPVHEAVSSFSHGVKRWFESRAGKRFVYYSLIDPVLTIPSDMFIAKQGYGQQLSRALIKMNRPITEILEADWMYSMFCNNGHLPLYER